MLVLEKKSWLQLVLVIRGSTLAYTWPRLLVVMLVAGFITWGHEVHGWFETSITPLPFSLIGLALGIFLGFRNNTSYDRYWEARKLWGRLVNCSRSLTRQVMSMVGSQEQAPVHKELVYRLIAYVHIFRHHLRDEEELVDARGFIPDDEISALAVHENRPNMVIHRMAQRLRELHQEGVLHAYHWPVLEASLTELLGIQGGCERIKSTPIPASYTVLIHRLVAFYVFLLPFGIIDTIGVFTPVVVFMVSYAFLGLDAIGTEIEEPFGTHKNDLPLSAMSRMIEVNLRRQLGEKDVPALHEPVDGILA